jgi:hypothetical protein
MPRASVPKTSVDKHGKSVFSKNEVRFAKEGNISTPASDSVNSE